MTFRPALLPVHPRTSCGAVPARQFATLFTLLAFVVTMAALGHPPHITAPAALALAAVAGHRPRPAAWPAWT
ncbi:hypothetical protein L6E12_19335 [Actinokineospora sp. PR83]|uniref:hypothetical protein n=1 Tax=Actinokineospora sp. PR83 TaxID=2884908 RepID=UPI001F285CA5|nr:hypothetical protein [Actinokineospora sp. PR83]MCG8917937.1 hypothetical protein [Actinokineospora sp. PR83]